MFYLTVVTEIWNLGFLFLWTNRKQLLRFIFLPAVLLGLFGAGIASAGEDKAQSGMLLGGYLIANIALYVMFAAAWHRFFLDPQAEKTVWQYMAWGRDKWRYLSVLLTLSLLFTILMHVLFLRPIFWLLHALQAFAFLFSAEPFAAELPAFEWQTHDGLVLLVLLLFSIPYARLILLLPAAASEERLNIPLVWSLSQGRVFLCFGVLISLVLAQIILAFCGLGLKLLMGNLLQGWLSLRLLEEFAWQIFSYASIAITITPLSVTYKILRRRQDKSQ